MTAVSNARKKFPILDVPAPNLRDYTFSVLWLSSLLLKDRAKKQKKAYDQAGARSEIMLGYECFKDAHEHTPGPSRYYVTVVRLLT